MSTPYYRGQTNQTTSNTSKMYRNFNGNGGNRNGQAEETSLSLMEMENNQRWSELGEQVNLLRNLSRDIHQEVNSQNQLLDSMSRGFSSTSDLFKSTMGKLGVMLNSSSSKHMYYLIVFVVMVFLLVYFMMGRRSSST
eukprot:gene10467-11597_t